MCAMGMFRARMRYATIACVTVTVMFAGQATAQPASKRDVMLTGQQSSSDVNPSGRDATCDKSAPTMDPTLSPEWLLEPPALGAKPMLVIGHYNFTQGLMAGYEGPTGKRILFHAIWVPNGRVAATATHVNPHTGRLQTFFGPRKLHDPATGNATVHVQFAGIDVQQYLKDARKRTPAPRADAVNEFIDSESGQAFFEAVPVLYAILETLETDPSLAALQAPFGVLVTALQIATTKYGGFAQADAVLGRAHANALRSDCHGRTCAFSGKRFSVHGNGLFDVVSKSRSPNAKRTSPQCTQGAVAAVPFAGIAPNLKNGNGICDEPGGCFGRCGRDCDGQPWLGNFQTQQCWAHDLCVCMWSDGDCFFFSGSNPPNGYCPGCGDLFDAAMSWFGGIFDWLSDWFTAWSFGVIDTLVNWP